MKKQRFFSALFFIFLYTHIFSQGFLLSEPKVEFDGYQLHISYDIISNKQNDQFFVWVEMVKKNNEPIKIKTLAGDVGDNIKSGKNRKITWVPSMDNVFLDEEVFVEVKAEKYVKSFNKASMLLLSTALPGLGQSKVSKGKPWWLTGIVAYGALAGGFISHRNYLNTYNAYRLEEDHVKRTDLLTQAQSQNNISNALILSGAGLWTANILWMALIPNKYKQLKYAPLSLYPAINNNVSALLTLKLNF